jgi:4-amino-4-deoxy-L-arabinose transferase-like glycosyltransferase
MAKKKVDRETGKKQATTSECDLDSGYTTPITTTRDFSLENIKSVFKTSRYLQALVVITALGLFFRFYDLGFNSLWLDEATTYYQSILSPLQIWQSLNGAEFNPPLFYWAEHFILMIGNSEAILRFIPAVAGTLTIPLMYILGKEYIDRNVGIIAAAAWAVSPFLIYYAQEARAYSLMLFFITLALIFYLRALENNKLSNWVFFGVFSALAFWSHFYVFVFILALSIYPLFLWLPDIKSKLKNLKMLVLGLGIFIVLSLPLLIVAVRLFGEEVGSTYIFGQQGPTLIIETFSQISGFNDIAAVFLVILFIVGVIQAYYLSKTKGIFLMWITLFTCLVSYVLSYKMSLFPRHHMFIILIFFIGIAISYKVFYSVWHHKAVVYLFIVALCLISAPTLVNYYSVYSKDDWRGFSNALAEKTSPGDFVITVPGYMNQPLDYYYSSAKAQTKEYAATTGEDLEKLYSQRGNSTMYFVVTQDIGAANPNGDAIAWLNNNTRYIGQDGGIFLFTSP